MSPPNKRIGSTSRTWARSLARRDDWVVLDLETTGRGLTAQPVEVAVVGPYGDVLFENLVRPACVIESDAVRLHGLDAAALVDAPSFSELYPALQRTLTNHLVIAYCAPFDRMILNRACEAAGLAPLGRRWECGFERYAEWRGFSASLATVCEIEGIAASHRRHRACEDARLLWKIIRRMANAPDSEAL